MADSEAGSLTGSLASGDSSQLSQSSAPSPVKKHGSTGHDRVPVDQSVHWASDSDEDESTPRSQLQLEQPAQRHEPRRSTAAARKRTKAMGSAKKPKPVLGAVRPRSALEAGVSIDEVFYRTYMGMQATLNEGRREMRHVADDKKAANNVLHSTVAESAMWYTARQTPKPRPAPSAQTRRSLCNFKAAAAFSMLYSEVAHKRKTEFLKEEQERRRVEKEEADRLNKEEDSAANRAMDRLAGMLGKRIKAEKEWLAERERRRRKPLTDLLSLNDGARKECRSWPDRINELQLARKQGTQIEKRADRLFREWWNRCRAACDYVWTGDDNPFRDAGNTKGGRRASIIKSKPDGERPTTPSRVTWSSSSQRKSTGQTEMQTTPLKSSEKETYLGDLPDLIELFRIKLFDSDGDMSYKTYEFLLKSKAKLILDRQSHLKEAVALEKEFKGVSESADAVLVPHEAKHEVEMAELEKQQQAELESEEQRLVEPQQRHDESEAELEKQKTKCTDFSFVVEKEEADLLLVYDRVKDLDDYMAKARLALSAERQKLRQLLASRRAANALNLMADHSKENRREQMEELEKKVEGMKTKLREEEARRDAERRSMLQLELEAVRYSGGFKTDREVAADFERLTGRVPAEAVQERVLLAELFAPGKDAQKEGKQLEEGEGKGETPPLEKEEPAGKKHRKPKVRTPCKATSEEVYAEVCKYIDAAEDEVSITEAKAHVLVRYPWIDFAEWEATLPGLYEQAFDESEIRTRNITPEEELRLLKLELSDYGYMEEEMDGFELEELKEMLQREKGDVGPA